MATEPTLITNATGTADEHRSLISRCLADASDYWALHDDNNATHLE
jgi:hypothetical protein